MEVNATAYLKVDVPKDEMQKIAFNVLLSTIDKEKFPWLKEYHFTDLYLDDENKLYKREEWYGHNREVDHIFIKKLNQQEALVYNIIKNLDNY